MKTLQLFLLSSLLLCFPVIAEVQKLTIKWSAGLCNITCSDLLRNAFLKIPSVADVEMNQPAGQAEIHWKPNQKISFIPINAAMSRVGLAIEDIRIKVRGTITHDDRGVTLISLGDSTPFQLLGPVVPDKNRYVIQYSPYTHPISPEMREELLQGEKEEKVATISGPLFMPERSPPFPLMIIVENIKFSNPKKEQ